MGAVCAPLNWRLAPPEIEYVLGHSEAQFLFCDREFLPALNPDYLPEGGSNYRAMLETSIRAFGTSTADRYLIVLSDGESTVDDWKEVSAALKTKGVRVIGLGRQIGGFGDELVGSGFGHGGPAPTMRPGPADFNRG